MLAFFLTNEMCTQPLLFWLKNTFPRTQLGDSASLTYLVL